MLSGDKLPDNITRLRAYLYVSLKYKTECKYFCTYKLNKIMKDIQKSTS